MQTTEPGTIELIGVLIIFLLLQVWWISLTIKNGRRKTLNKNKYTIEKIKKNLERLFHQH